MSRRSVLIKPGITPPPPPPPPPSEYGATPPPNGIVPGSTRVTSAAAFTAALDDGVLDITLDAVVNAPSGGFRVPRLSQPRTIRGTEIALIQSSGACIQASGSSGGRFILDHLRCDGGWRSDKRHSSGTDIPFRFTSCDYVSFRNCVTCYSKDLGMLFNYCIQAEVLNCTFFCTATGAYSDDNVRDFLCQDSWFQFGGDDSVQWHQTQDIDFLRTNSVIIRHNLVRDYHGGKTHAGMADGTFNGKESQSLWENNTFEGNNRYGVEFNNSTGSASFHGAPRNFKFIGNTVKNLTRIGASARNGVPVGYGLNVSLQSGNSFDSSCEVRNNTFIRDPSLQDRHNQDVYDWAAIGSQGKPPWVPGAEDQGGGFWSEGGFVPSFTIDLAYTGVRLSGDNSGAVTHSGNIYQGSGWTSTLS